MELLNLIPIISTLGFVSLFSYKTKIVFRNSLPIIVSVITAILYVTLALNIGYYGAIVLYMLGFLSLIYVYKQNPQFFDTLKHNKLKISGFVLLFFCISLYYKQAIVTVSVWDDMTTWGIFSKELLIRNRFETSNDPSSILSFYAHYPRGASVFHYFYLLPTTFYYNAGESSEVFSYGGALFAQFLLYFVFIAPIFFNKNITSTIIVVAVILSISAWPSPALRGLYNDAIIGFIFASTMLIYLSEKDKSNILLFLLPLQIILPLFKEIGMILAFISAIVLGYYHLKFLFHKKLIGVSLDHTKIYLLAITPFLISCIHCIYFEFTHDLLDRNPHSISNIINVISGFGYQDFLDIGRFLKLLVISLYKEAAIATYVTIYVAYYFTKKEDQYLHEEYKVLMRALFYGFLGFIMWRLYIYVFIWRDSSGNGLLIRYLSSYGIIFSVISGFFLLKTKILVKGPKKNAEKIIFVVVSFLALLKILYTFDRVQTFVSLDEKIFLKQVNNVKQRIAKGEKVHFSYENKENAISCHFLSYAIAPYISSDEIKKCINYPIKHHNVYSGKIKTIPQKPEGTCTAENGNIGDWYLVYKPFLLEYHYQCKE